MSISLSKCPTLATIAWCFIRAMRLDGDDVLVAGGGDDDVGLVDDVVQPGHLVALQQRLQRADRVRLGDDHPGALPASAAAAPLPTSPKPQTSATLPPISTSVARFRPSIIECRMP